MPGKRAPLPFGHGNACYFLEPKHKTQVQQSQVEKTRTCHNKRGRAWVSQSVRPSLFWNAQLDAWIHLRSLPRGLGSPVHGSRKELFFLQNWLTTETNCMHVATGSVNTLPRQGVARYLAALALQHLHGFRATSTLDQQISDQFEQTKPMSCNFCFCQRVGEHIGASVGTTYLFDLKRERLHD